MTEAEKLGAAVVSLEGEALAWFQWEDMRRRIRSWDELKMLIVERFRFSQEGLVSERFWALR